MIKLQSWWRRARESFWFLPALIVIACVLMAFALVEIDARVDGEWLNRMPMLFGAGAQGSRGLLSVVASSMITVAGVVFSITIVALSLTSSQYSSRVLRNFMGDRPNQFVLGAFVGIFAYCLVVLRTIRGGDEGAFVPSFAVLMALVLGLAGIAVLIFFIHHIAVSIQASQILATVAEETLRAVDRLFPSEIGQEAELDPEDLPLAGRTWQYIPAAHTGYIQAIQANALLERAGVCRSVVRMERSIGEFVVAGMPLAAILADAELKDKEIAQLQSAFSIDRQRTLDQDAAFGIRQIVDIALKALSPGINDTTTAVMCLDFLTAILVCLSGRKIESRFRGEDGELRLITKGPTFESLTNEAFDQIRQNATGNVAVIDTMLWSLETLISQNYSLTRLRVLAAQACAIEELVRNTIPLSADRQRLEARCRPIVEGLRKVVRD